jgi:hypothetical protein
MSSTSDLSPLSFALRSRTRSLHLSATQIASSPIETQHNLCVRIAEIAKLPLNRIRVTFENPRNVVLDKRVQLAETAPRMSDVVKYEPVLLVKDLGLQIPVGLG